MLEGSIVTGFNGQEERDDGALPVFRLPASRKPQSAPRRGTKITSVPFISPD